MRVNEFEKTILAMGLTPKEVRLERNHVKWFICGGNSDYDIIVFDSEGAALVLPSFFWPEEVNDVHIEVYSDNKGQILGVTINGMPAQRDSRLDLKFDIKVL